MNDKEKKHESKSVQSAEAYLGCLDKVLGFLLVGGEAAALAIHNEYNSLLDKTVEQMTTERAIVAFVVASAVVLFRLLAKESFKVQEPEQAPLPRPRDFDDSELTDFQLLEEIHAAILSESNITPPEVITDWLLHYSGVLQAATSQIIRVLHWHIANNMGSYNEQVFVFVEGFRDVEMKLDELGLKGNFEKFIFPPEFEEMSKTHLEAPERLALLEKYLVYVTQLHAAMARVKNEVMHKNRKG